MRLLAIILTLIIFATNLNAQSLKDLQSKLNAIGFWSGNPDGVMGKKTKHGIVFTPVIGNCTWMRFCEDKWGETLPLARSRS